MTESKLPASGRISHPEWLPYASLVFVMIIHAISVIVSRDIRAEIPPVGLTFWRYLIATVLLLPFVYRQCVEQWRGIRQMWRHIVVIAVAQAALGQVLFYVGLHTTTATNAGLIIALQPAIVILCAFLVLGDVMSRSQVLGLGLALVGAAIIVVRGDLNVMRNLDFVIGDFWVLLAILCWGYYAILVRQCAAVISPLVIFETQSFVAFVSLLPIYIIEMTVFGNYMPVTLHAAGTVMFFAVFSSIIALGIVIYAIATIGPGRSAMFSYLIPPFTAIGAVALLGESFERHHLIGMVAVLGGVFLATRQPMGGRN